jgi:hypothetical protein
MDGRIHVRLAKSCTDENSRFSSIARIACSLTFGLSVSVPLSLLIIHLVSFMCFVTVEHAIASSPRIVTSYLWMAEDENSCLLRNMQIDC